MFAGVRHTSDGQLQGDGCLAHGPWGASSHTVVRSDQGGRFTALAGAGR